MELKSNLEKLNAIASSKNSGWYEKARKRQENKGWRDHSFEFALIVLRIIRSKNITQKELADKMDVSPQYVNKVLKGEENISFETVSKFERALGLPLLKFAPAEAYYVMRVSNGIAVCDYAIKGQKAEPSYITLLQNKPEKASLFVKANEFESTEPAGLTVCSQ